MGSVHARFLDDLIAMCRDSNVPLHQAVKVTGWHGLGLYLDFIGIGVRSETMNADDSDSYEDRIRDKHPDKLWWEDWRGNKWLFFWIIVAVVAMIVVGFLVS